MKSAREEMVESFKNVEAFERAIAEKVKNDMNYLAYEPAAVFAAASVILCVQQNFNPDDKDIVIDYDMLFELSDITERAKKKFFRDALGDGIGNLNDMFFMFPDRAIQDYLAARGSRNLRLARG